MKMAAEAAGGVDGPAWPAPRCGGCRWCGRRRRGAPGAQTGYLQRVIPQLDLLRRVIRIQPDGGHRAVALVLRNQWRQLRDQLETADHFRLGRRRPLHPHEREADRIEASEGVHGLGFHVVPRLGYEERVPGLRVLGAEPHEVGAVNIGPEHVDLRRPGSPDVKGVGHGAAALPASFEWRGGPSKSVLRAVGDHRYGVLGLARLHYPFDVARKAPGHEDLIRRPDLAEHLRPGPRGLETGRFPHLAQRGNQSGLVLPADSPSAPWEPARRKP